MGFVAPSEASPRLKAATVKALALDDSLPEVHQQLANTYAWADWNWTAAEREFQRAIDLNPNYAEARTFYAHYLMMMKRRDEAQVQMRRALELDPLNAFSRTLYSQHLLFMHRFDEALAEAREVLKTQPGSPGALTTVRAVLHQRGLYDEAFAEEKSYRAARGDREMVVALDHGYAKGGYREAMRRAADVMAARPGNLGPFNVASLYLRAGETDRALEWLDKAYSTRDPELPNVNSGIPLWDGLRDNPRFQSVLHRMNLPK